jgi:hypothetical protein
LNTRNQREIVGDTYSSRDLDTGQRCLSRWSLERNNHRVGFVGLIPVLSLAKSALGNISEDLVIGRVSDLENTAVGRGWSFVVDQNTVRSSADADTCH